MALEKKSTKARGGRRVHFSVSGRAGTGVGLLGKRPVGPRSPAKAADGVVGWYALTTEVVTAEPRPGHTQGKEEACRTTLVAAS